MFGAGALLPLFINPLFSFQEGDVTEAETMKRALKGADVVVHLAGLVGYPLCKKLRRDHIPGRALVQTA